MVGLCERSYVIHWVALMLFPTMRHAIQNGLELLNFLSKWCNEMHSIGNAEMVSNFMQLPSDMSMQLWDNILFAVLAPHIKENTHLAKV
jgi:hypothetical protein